MVDHQVNHFVEFHYKKSATALKLPTNLEVMEGLEPPSPDLDSVALPIELHYRECHPTDCLQMTYIGVQVAVGPGQTISRIQSILLCDDLHKSYQQESLCRLHDFLRNPLLNQFP